MIPLGDTNTPRQKQVFPFVMVGLILVNVAVFIREITLPINDANCFVYAYSFDPKVLLGQIAEPSAYAQLCQGSQFGLIPAWATVFTAMFLHASVLHIAGNMIFLFVFGDNVEDRLGHLGFLIFYLVCGAVAAGTQAFLSPTDMPNLGASGAIAGVLGAYLVFFPKAQVRVLIILGFIPLWPRLSAMLVILAWFVLQLFNGYTTLNDAGAAAQDGTAYFAHIGGFIVGFALGGLIRIMMPRETPAYLYGDRYS